MDSDESDFYGDDDVTSRLTQRLQDFDPQEWWSDTFSCPPPLMRAQPSAPIIKKSPCASPTVTPSQPFSHGATLKNPMSSIPFAWQLTETIPGFLSRLPPSTTVESPEIPCIFICNPYAQRTVHYRDWQSHVLSHGSEQEGPELEGADLGTVLEGATERLGILHSFELGVQKVRKPQATKTREINLEKGQAVSDILGLAHMFKIRSGKWLLLVKGTVVDEVWQLIAQATADGTLGIAAKVKPAVDPASIQPAVGGTEISVEERAHKKERLISVYTEDFSNREDVQRVLQRLRELKVLTGKPIYYKPDIYTYLGIAFGNKYDLKASLYSSKDFPLVKP